MRKHQNGVGRYLLLLISEFGLLMEYSYIFFYFWVLRRISNVALLTDLAFRIIHMYEKLVNYVNDQGLSPLHILASKPSLSEVVATLEDGINGFITVSFTK